MNLYPSDTPHLEGGELPDLSMVSVGKEANWNTGPAAADPATRRRRQKDHPAGSVACPCVWEDGRRIATCNDHLPTKSTTLEGRWGKRVMGNGFSAVPGLLLDNAYRLGRNCQKITPTQLAILTSIARSFRHADQLVEIADSEIAKRMGCTRSTVSKAAQGLHDMGLVLRHIEKDGDRNNLPAKYDVAPLIARLEELVGSPHPW